MSYTAREQSAYDGHPLELYRFAMGNEQWLYTSADHAVAYVTDEYQPVFIKRGPITKGGDTRKSTIEIEVAASNPITMLFRNGWMVAPMIVTVFRHHYEDNEFAVVWKGRITGCKWKGSMATLTSDSVFTLFKRAGLRRVYQIGCPHQLYGPGCTLDIADWRINLICAAVSGNQLTVTGANAYPNGYFVGGMVLSGSDYMMIVAHSGNTITLLDALPAATIGASIGLWPGCERTMATCDGRFSNLDNFGGLPFLPKKNPFSGDALV